MLFICFASLHFCFDSLPARVLQRQVWDKRHNSISSYFVHVHLVKPLRLTCCWYYIFFCDLWSHIYIFWFNMVMYFSIFTVYFSVYPFLALVWLGTFFSVKIKVTSTNSGSKETDINGYTWFVLVCHWGLVWLIPF